VLSDPIIGTGTGSGVVLGVSDGSPQPDQASSTDAQRNGVIIRLRVCMLYLSI
jgi:hypothetical protein